MANGANIPPRAHRFLIYGGFWRRALAAAMDLALVIAVAFLTSIGIAIVAAVVLTLAHTAPEVSARVIRTGTAVWVWALQWLYFAVLESSSWQATLGKKAMGVRVADLEGDRIGFVRASFRFWCKVLCLGPIGFLAAAFSDKSQGFHDMLAQTVVVQHIEVV